MDQREQALADLQSWVASGKLKVQEDVIEGLENTPKALIGLLAGENRGKRMIKGESFLPPWVAWRVFCRRRPLGGRHRAYRRNRRRPRRPLFQLPLEEAPPGRPDRAVR